MSDNPHMEELRRRLATETNLEELQSTAEILRDFLRQTIVVLMSGAPTKKARHRLADTLAEL